MLSLLCLFATMQSNIKGLIFTEVKKPLRSITQKRCRDLRSHYLSRNDNRMQDCHDYGARVAQGVTLAYEQRDDMKIKVITLSG